MIHLFFDLFVTALVVILSADLLYLYYAGGWYDPIKVIEWAEVTLLYFFTMAGLLRFVLQVIQVKNNYRPAPRHIRKIVNARHQEYGE